MSDVQISAALVKDLRERTGAGMMDCKRALQETGGDLETASDYLRKQGIASAGKKAGRAANEGLVHAYIHQGGKIGVLVEINCETDFVARTDDFQVFCQEVAMQVAAASPLYVTRDEVPEEVVAKEREIYREAALNEGKPENVADRIVEGKVQKYFEQVCLLEQPYIRDSDKTVEELLKETIASLGENIQIARFTRYVLGEGAA
ncbi:translation elongation factor Ts [Gemmatimonadota bacterium]